jgi:hypothetical protein
MHEGFELTLTQGSMILAQLDDVKHRILDEMRSTYLKRSQELDDLKRELGRDGGSIQLSLKPRIELAHAVCVGIAAAPRPMLVSDCQTEKIQNSAPRKRKYGIKDEFV